MEFCDVCDNMLYVSPSSVPGEAELGLAALACLHCGSRKPIARKAGEPSVLVSETRYGDDSARYLHYVTPDLHEDPTLPRTDCACPKPGCGGDKAIYVKYDETNMKYIYSCVRCKTFWGPDGVIDA